MEPAGGVVTGAAELHRTMLALVQRDGRDLTARQLVTLMSVHLDERAHSVGSLARRLAVPRPCMTRILDRLVAHGLVGRENSLADRRVVFVRRTAAGEAFVREMGEIAGVAYAAAAA